MFYSRNLAYLRAELSVIERRLERLPEGAILARRGMQGRKGTVIKELQSAELRAANLGEAVLTFAGDPVHGVSGIDAHFAGDAISSFGQFVANMAATDEEVGARGKLAATAARLTITDVARGSFGFELSEVVDSVAPTEPTRLKVAVDTAVDVLQSAKDGDNQLVAAITPLRPRSVRHLKAFLKRVSDAEATFTFGATCREVQYSSGEAKAAYARLETVTDDYAEAVVEGNFYPLPNGRRFELEQEGGVVFSGQVTKEIGSADELRTLAGKKVRMTLEIVTRPNRKHSYFAMEIRPVDEGTQIAKEDEEEYK